MIFNLFGKKTKFINSGYCEPQFNMDYDLSLVSKLDSPDIEAFFRIYAWKPFSISLGMHQNENEIDLERLKKDNFEIVRRPTGGRAVFHANELTYSYITKLDNIDKNKVYELIHVEFDKILNSIGIKSDFVKVNSNYRDIYKNSESKSLCFAATAKYEIEIEGRKLIGSAQRIIDNKLLQHGSIPIDNTHLNIVNYINTSNKYKLKEILSSKSTDISSHNSEIKNYDNFAVVIEKYFNIY